MRRLRASEPLRNLVRETQLDPADFILPLFTCPGRRRSARNQLHARQCSALGRQPGEGMRRGRSGSESAA